MADFNDKILIISGPTASGKTALSLEIAKNFPVEIINADALQLYESLPILSCQPTKEEQKKVPHHLYSILKADEKFSVALWLESVKSIVEEIWQRKKLPVILGGTGMYISKLIDGISQIPQISDETRKQTNQLFSKIGIEEFRQELIKLGEDQEIVQKLDKQRLLRCFEVLSETKKSLFYWQNQNKKKIFPNGNFLHLNIEPNREELYAKCNDRFKLITKSGAIAEVQNLIKSGISAESPICKTIGFLEIKAFLAGEINEEEMIKISSQKTRNYAKRQLTWFRHQFKEKFLIKNPQKELSEIFYAIKNFLNWHR